MITKNITKKILVVIAWLLIAPLAASITSGTPHPVRAIPMIPVLHILVSIGFIDAWVFIQKQKSALFKVSIKIFIISAFFINIVYYFHQYYIHTPIEYGDFWQYGNKEAIEYARQHENEYKKIVMSYKIDQPYIFYLFYNKIDPVWYQNNWSVKGNIGRFERKIGKYEFRYIDFGKDSQNKSTLIIGTPDEIPSSAKVIKKIRYLDGSIAYRIVRT